jgi:hypothetical protein
MKRYLTAVIRSDRLSEPQLRIARLRYSTIWAALLVITTMSIGQAKALNIEDKQMYKLYAHMKLLDDKQYRCLVKLWTAESQWSPTASNPMSSAYGIPQLLRLKETNPFKQIDRGLDYIAKHRKYKGDVCLAYKHHLAKGYY